MRCTATRCRPCARRSRWPATWATWCCCLGRRTGCSTSSRASSATRCCGCSPESAPAPAPQRDEQGGGKHRGEDVVDVVEGRLQRLPVPSERTGPIGEERRVEQRSDAVPDQEGTVRHAKGPGQEEQG